MRVIDSPEYATAMKARENELKREAARAEREWSAIIKSGVGRDWTPIARCPFAILDRRDEAILVTDGKAVTVARITHRFGTPLFWKTPPEQVLRDGMICWEGGETAPRPDLPKWWWAWEIRDELERETWAYGEPAGQPEVDFVATAWRFLPAPPARTKVDRKLNRTAAKS